MAVHAVGAVLRDAVAQHEAGDLQQAERLYRQVLKHVPNHAGTLHQLALLVHRCGRSKEAIDLLTRAVAAEPADAVGHNNLGNMLREQGRMKEAITAYRAAVRCRPDYITAHFNLAGIFNDEWALEAAEECYRSVLRLSPEDAEAWNGLGTVMQKQGRVPEAIEAYQTALRFEADYANAHNNLGLALQAQGDLKAANACYRKAIALEPDYAKAHENIVRSRRYGPADRDEIARLEALVGTPETSEEALMSLHFALGKVYDDCGAFEQAFSHYQAGNRLKRKTVKFKRERHIAEASDIIATFDRQFFERRTDFGDVSDLPVFIVGMPRSGTTLVEQIIASHPRAFGAGELHQVTNIAVGLRKRLHTHLPYPKCATMIDRSLAQSLAEGYLDYLKGAGGDALRVTDKAPGNFIHLGLIALMFPNARVIHCRREALDVCLSIYFQRFERGHNYAYDLSDIAVSYRQYERMMRHWREVLPLKIYEVQYEAQIADQEAVSRRLIDYCGLPWDERCLEYYKNKRAVQTASSWQARQPIYSDSVKRWKRYEKYLGELKEGLAQRA
ncbi:MAG: sulfotransferase [Gammaproteobacteria bacterium]|jgi:tetratricopeptide (TPR) repeat protein|nr:sulfotransferase [Gammaproteobacteria bacterium]